MMGVFAAAVAVLFLLCVTLIAYLVWTMHR
jgi:hypothetical protein